jgi:threonyl-tRNA synthetase
MEKYPIEVIRHSLAHVMAAAVKNLYPQAKFGMGPAIESGFYYDFDFEGAALVPEKLKEIEVKMKKLIGGGLKFERKEVAIAEAKKIFEGQQYKLEIIAGLEAKGEASVLVYQTGDFTDLCRGPHAESSKDLPIDGFKLIKIAGAYWKGSEKNKMLTRVYAAAFPSKPGLDAYLKNQEEAEKRDHRKVGKEMGLFVFSELVGPGLPLYTFKGAAIRQEIINYSNELQKKIGYENVCTPNINKADLFKVSGHYDKYRDDMFRVVSNYTEEEYYLKPMNCPQHTQIYAAEIRSYKDLPIRIADFANLYRDEKPGELSGLTRIRAFCQDDGHCFCREDQIKEEFGAVLSVINEALDTYGMKYFVRLSLWDPEHSEKYLGEAATWEKSQATLKAILDENKMGYVVGVGEAAIYGPKMDIMTKDSLGREWQISTIQLDFIMPQRFGLSYIDQNGKEKTPVMIHRAIVGSPERFMGILIEHYAGAFPVWLAPVQVKVLSVGESHAAFCKKLGDELRQAGVRIEIDMADETLGNKIRKAAGEKIPYVLVIGDKEMQSDMLSVRDRASKETRQISKSDFIGEVCAKIKDRN